MSVLGVRVLCGAARQDQTFHEKRREEMTSQDAVGHDATRHDMTHSELTLLDRPEDRPFSSRFCAKNMVVWDEKHLR